MTESIPKADYSAIAPTYDEARRLPDDAIEMWVDLIRDEGKLTPGSLFMDRVFCEAEGVGFNLTVHQAAARADLSADMLKQVSSKSGTEAIRWVRCSAQKLAFKRDQFQRVFMSLLHHVDDIGLVGCVSFVQPRMKTWRQRPSVSFFACL